jgi:hypothetical protein
MSREESCDPAQPNGILQITVLDRRGQPMPGIEITITWSEGEERFFTGLQPEISAGYADFIMQPETRYSIQVARAGAPVSGLTAPVCARDEGQSYFGGLRLAFREP